MSYIPRHTKLPQYLFWPFIHNNIIGESNCLLRRQELVAHVKIGPEGSVPFLPFIQGPSTTIIDPDPICLVKIDGYYPQTGALAIQNFDNADPSIKPYILIQLRESGAHQWIHGGRTLITDLSQYYYIGSEFMTRFLTTGDKDEIRKQIKIKPGFNI